MHIRMNKLSLWMREMECKLISPELSTFKPEWLRYWDVTPERMEIIIAIDPASSDRKSADDQVIMALGFWKGDIFVLEYSANKGEMPDAAAEYIFHLIRKYGRQVRKIAVESVAYQRVLAWYLEKEMAARRLWRQIDQIDDRRRKSDRIIQELVGPAANGRLYVHRSHTKLITQFTEYSPRINIHDDLLDALAIGVMSYRDLSIDAEYEVVEDERDVPPLPQWRTAP